MTRQRNVYKQAYNAALRLLGTGPTLASEPELGVLLGVSRTTVRSILSRMNENGLIDWNKRQKAVLRRPTPADFFPEGETDPLSVVVERTFLHRLMQGGMGAGTPINELELARDIGVGTTAVREFLIRFSRFGLIEKRPNSHWVLKGFTPEFALELAEVRDMFELRSAAAFAGLPASSPLWSVLDRIEGEHLSLRPHMDERFADFTALDERFHRLIHGAAQNRFIDEFYDVIALVFHHHYQWNKANERQRNKAALEEHLAYIAALRSRAPGKVESACRAHLASARQTLLDSMSRDTDA